MSYKNINIAQMSFVDSFVEKRTSKNKFYTQINQIIDWKPIEKELKKVYKRGRKERGCKAYNPLVLFKMQLVSVWYDLSDVKVEEMVNDSLSAMKFCGLSVEDPVPDHSTLSRFRSELTEKKAYERLLKKINQQLIRHKLIVKGGIKVDASLTDSPFNSKGKTTFEIVEDREESSAEQLEQEKKYYRLKKIDNPNADNQARWVKKRGKFHYGYKKHIGVDVNGMILGVYTTTSNEHDSKGLAPLIKAIPKTQRKEVMADKGYQSKANVEFLRANGSKSRIMYKAYKNRPLTHWEEKFNRLVSKTRWVVERTFGSLKRWFGSGKTRLKGKKKVHGVHLLESIAHNLKRSPGLAYQLAK